MGVHDSLLSQARVDRLGLEREHGEHAFVYPPERLGPCQAVEAFKTERVLPLGQRPLVAEAAVAQPIEVDTGPEVIVGSTRLKAGTAQKLVLNMLSTAAMVRLGKTYGDLMVDLQATNEKLRDRARRIVAQAAGVDDAQAAAALAGAGGEVKVAVVMLRCGVPAGRAAALVEAAGGNLRRALDQCG